jgi:hypothetical protein
MRTLFRLVLVALVLALVATACGDDDTTETTVPDDPTTTAAAPTTTTATTMAAPTPGDDLAMLLESYETTALRTTYVFRDSGEETTVILSQQPNADPPVEAVIIPAANTQLIRIGEESIFCDTTANQCFALPSGAGTGFSEGMLGPFVGGLFLAAGLDQIPAADISEETTEIAGRAGICFTFSPPPDAGFDTELIRQCVDSELGFTLLIQAQETGSDTVETIMELVEFGEPLEEDFTPTGPVAEAP